MQKKRHIFLFSLFFFLFLFYPLSGASARVPKDYFWRLHFGTGLGAFTDEPADDGSKLAFEGQSGLFGLKLGSMYSRDTSIDFSFTSITDNNAKIKSGGTELEDVTGAYGLAALGFGISHFFGGFYISPEFRYVFRALTEFGGKAIFKGTGYGLSFGTEWRWSSRWNMGVALMYISDSLKGVEVGPPFESYDAQGSHSFYGIALTLTYD